MRQLGDQLADNFSFLLLEQLLDNLLLRLLLFLFLFSFFIGLLIIIIRPRVTILVHIQLHELHKETSKRVLRVTVIEQFVEHGAVGVDQDVAKDFHALSREQHLEHDVLEVAAGYREELRGLVALL